MQHGLALYAGRMGTCCYNRRNPGTYSSYDIDPVGCRSCIDQENNNVKSYRQGANEQYGLSHAHRSPIVLDFSPNHNCNLSCKICNETVSSSWAKLKQIKINKNYNVSVNKFSSVLSEFNLSNVKEINFGGGETLLNNSIVKYLGTLENQVDFSNCTLRFVTNGTIPLTPVISEFFLKFKLVQARFSIDDIGVGFEYQRYPAKWDQFEQNWQHFLNTMPHNVMPAINRTVSILNIRRLHLLDQWHANYSTTKFGDPIELIDHYAFGNFSLEYITPELKENIEINGPSRSWDYVKFRQTHANNCLQKTFQEYDTFHRTSLEQFDPELYRIIFS